MWLGSSKLTQSTPEATLGAAVPATMCRTEGEVGKCWDPCRKGGPDAEVVKLGQVVTGGGGRQEHFGWYALSKEKFNTARRQMLTVRHHRFLPQRTTTASIGMSNVLGEGAGFTRMQRSQRGAEASRARHPESRRKIWEDRGEGGAGTGEGPGSSEMLSGTEGLRIFSK